MRMVIKAASARHIKYTATDRLELIIALYLSDDEIVEVGPAGVEPATRGL
jgi:hypothetical protein